MVVTQVNRQKVTSAEEFRAAMKKNSLEEGILMLVHSEEGARFVVLSSNAS